MQHEAKYTRCSLRLHLISCEPCHTCRNIMPELHCCDRRYTVAQNSDVVRKVLAEFAGLYQELTETAGINVNLFQHSAVHDTPDACFPNNWFTTHAIGEARGAVTENTLVLYPMKNANRSAFCIAFHSKGFVRLPQPSIDVCKASSSLNCHMFTRLHVSCTAPKALVAVDTFLPYAGPLSGGRT